MKLKVFCIYIVFSLFLLASCSNKKNLQVQKSPKKRSSQITIGFSIDTLAIERWQRDLDIFMNTAKELGAGVIVQNAGNSVEEQKKQLLYLLERNVDVMVVLPKDAKSLTDEVQKIKNKGIPIISYDRLILDSDIDLYMSINSEKVGQLMGQGLLSTCQGKNWYCILGAQEDYNMSLILDGVKKAIKGKGVELNHIFYTAGWNYDLSYQEMVRLISEGKIPDAIICGNDSVASSVIQALDRYYPDSNLPICGQDADIAACQYIVQGKQSFTIYKPITKLAELAAKYAVLMAKGQSIYDGGYNLLTIDNGNGEMPVLWLEPVLVNKENLDQVIIDSGFHSESSIYNQKALN